jgi:YtkA-like
MNGLPIAVVFAAALVTGACAAAPSGIRAVTAGDDRAPRGGDRIALVVGGVEEVLPDGAPIPVSRTLAATIRITPLPGVAHARVLQVRVLRGDTAVSDASVRANAHMRFMDHGSFQVVAVPSGNGSYVAPLQFAMAGEWTLTVEIQTVKETGEIALDLDAFD